MMSLLIDFKNWIGVKSTENLSAKSGLLKIKQFDQAQRALQHVPVNLLWKMSKGKDVNRLRNASIADKLTSVGFQELFEMLE